MNIKTWTCPCGYSMPEPLRVCVKCGGVRTPEPPKQTGETFNCPECGGLFGHHRTCKYFRPYTPEEK